MLTHFCICIYTYLYITIQSYLLLQYQSCPVYWAGWGCLHGWEWIQTKQASPSLGTYGLNSCNGSNLWVGKLDPVEAFASLWLVKLDWGRGCNCATRNIHPDGGMPQWGCIMWVALRQSGLDTVRSSMWDHWEGASHKMALHGTPLFRTT